jgi:hypothetical protein
MVNFNVLNFSFLRRGVLSENLTSYDVLKAIAIVLMLCDHIGYHFYPDETMLRVLGRLCIPIWFFLIGYSRTRDIPTTFWVGAVAVSLSAVMAGQVLLPLNILFALIIWRAVIGSIMHRALAVQGGLFGAFVTFIILAWPTSFLMEYGTLVVPFVMLGFLVRAYQDGFVSRWTRNVFGAAAFGAYFFIKGLKFTALTLLETGVLLGGLIAVFVALIVFKPHEWAVKSNVAKPLTRSLQILGRHTLLIYVVHVIVLRIISVILEPERFPFLSVKIAPDHVIQTLSTMI